MNSTAVNSSISTELNDEQVVVRVLAGETGLFEILMRRYNQRLYRTARSILRNDHEAEDVMQDSYVRAYTHLAQFAGRAKFSTWLTRIAVHEALSRLHKQNRSVALPGEDRGDIQMTTNPATGPEEQASSAELHKLLEESIDALPAHYRTVFVLRMVEQLSTEDTATALDLTPDIVKIRLHRARAMMRKHL
ncbi:MAG TPA: RNA polymerase sigma factor, partial [Clostridia bacterium]|nr:RNA polymerase sigma factor [Clostridia bacterium]